MTNTTNADADLKLLCAYWCHEAKDGKDDRYYWACEKVNELTFEVSDVALLTLIALTMTAPGEQAGANFAAGPLENYTNLIVERNLADVAAFMIGNAHLKDFMPYVWGDINKLQELSMQGNASKAYVPLLSLNNGLKSLSAKVLIGFWCHVCASSTTNDYQKYYDEVLKQLLNNRHRDGVIHDLTVTAPDCRADAYLKEKILIA